MMHTLAIFVVTSLLGQGISSTYADVGDERKKAEDITKKFQAELDQAKATLNAAKKTWKNAKDATETAKDAFEQNKTDGNLAAVKQAKQAEASAFQAYQKALKNVQNFKKQFKDALDSLKKAKSQIDSSKSSQSVAREKSKEITKKIQADLDKEKVIFAHAKKIWKDAKITTDSAQAKFEQNPTDENLDALNQAKQAEDAALQNYKKASADIQGFKPNITPDVIEKAQKSSDGATGDSKSQERKKAEDITKKIQAQLDQAKSALKSATLVWDNSKVAKDLAKQTFTQNPTDENFSALNKAKQDEAAALFFYHKALMDVKFFKAKIDDFN